jgi:hypothetical protein
MFSTRRKWLLRTYVHEIELKGERLSSLYFAFLLYNSSNTLDTSLWGKEGGGGFYKKDKWAG